MNLFAAQAGDRVTLSFLVARPLDPTTLNARAELGAQKLEDLKPAATCKDIEGISAPTCKQPERYAKCVDDAQGCTSSPWTLRP